LPWQLTEDESGNLSAEQLVLKGDRNGALTNFEKAFERRPDLSELPGLIAEMGGFGHGCAKKSPGRTRHKKTNFIRRRMTRSGRRRLPSSAWPRLLRTPIALTRSWRTLPLPPRDKTKPFKEYQVVLKQKPDRPGIHEAIGAAQLKRSKLEDALSEFEVELQIQPRSASAHTNVAQVLILMSRDDEARSHLETGPWAGSAPLEIYRMLGKLALNRKDYRLAAESLNHYISLRNDDSTAYYLLSRAYRGLGDQKAMERAMDLFQRTSPDAKARKRAESN